MRSHPVKALGRLSQIGTGMIRLAEEKTMRKAVILLLAMTAPLLAQEATPLFNGRDLSNFDIGYSDRIASSLLSILANTLK